MTLKIPKPKDYILGSPRMVMEEKERQEKLDAIVEECNCPHWVTWCSHLHEFYTVVYS